MARRTQQETNARGTLVALAQLLRRVTRGRRGASGKRARDSLKRVALLVECWADTNPLIGVELVGHDISRAWSAQIRSGPVRGPSEREHLLERIDRERIDDEKQFARVERMDARRVAAKRV